LKEKGGGKNCYEKDLELFVPISFIKDSEKVTNRNFPTTKSTTVN